MGKNVKMKQQSPLFYNFKHFENKQICYKETQKGTLINHISKMKEKNTKIYHSTT